MSLAPYLPPTSGEAGAVMALLQVIAHPADAKAVLEKMIAERKAIEAATEKQRELMQDTLGVQAKTRQDNEKLQREAELKADKAHVDLSAAKSALALAERRKAEIEAAEKRVAEASTANEEREEKLNTNARELAVKWQQLKAQQSDCEKREHALVKREEDIAAREKQLADDIRENEKWLAGLKPPRSR